MSNIVEIGSKVEETYRARYNRLTSELRLLVQEIPEDISDTVQMARVADGIETLSSNNPAEDERMRVFEVAGDTTYWVAARTWFDALEVVRDIVDKRCWSTDIETLSVTVMADASASEVLIAPYGVEDVIVNCLELSLAATEPTLLGYSEQ